MDHVYFDVKYWQMFQEKRSTLKRFCSYFEYFQIFNLLKSLAQYNPIQCFYNAVSPGVSYQKSTTLCILIVYQELCINIMILTVHLPIIIYLPMLLSISNNLDVKREE